MVIIIGDIFAFLVKEHGIPIAGDLRKGINPLSISQLTFMDKHVNLAVKAGFLSRILALAGAQGREYHSFAVGNWLGY
ncbi:unnamed protein product [Urochloa humidicola]